MIKKTTKHKRLERELEKFKEQREASIMNDLGGHGTSLEFFKNKGKFMRIIITNNNNS